MGETHEQRINRLFPEVVLASPKPSPAALLIEFSGEIDNYNSDDYSDTPEEPESYKS